MTAITPLSDGSSKFLLLLVSADGGSGFQAQGDSKPDDASRHAVGAAKLVPPRSQPSRAREKTVRITFVQGKRIELNLETNQKREHDRSSSPVRAYP